MSKPPRLVALGDLHSGSTTGLAPKARVSNKRQEWVLQKYNEAVKYVLGGGPYVLSLGADLIEGHHHGTLQVWGNYKEQRDAAIELLQPLANRAVEIYGLLGTEAHAGDNAEHDNQVSQELGARAIDHHHWLRLGGKIASIAHHGISVPKSGWLDDSGAIAAIRQTEYDYLNGNIKYKPDCLISHDAHRSPKPVTIRGITAGVAGCWQLPTAYGSKISPRRSVDIGFLIWHPLENRLERIVYDQPQTIREVKWS